MKNKKKLTSDVKKYIFLGMISLYMTTASVGFGADSKLGIIEKKNSNLPNLKIYNSNLPESEYSAWSTINLDKKMVIIGSKEDTVLFNADKAWHFYGGYTISANELKNYTLIIDKITGENVNAYGGHTNDRELVSDNIVKITNSIVKDVYGGYALKLTGSGGLVKNFASTEGNIVVIANESPNTYTIQNVYGSHGKTVNNNKIYLKNAMITGDLAGGKADENSSEYKNNELYLLSTDNKAGNLSKFDFIRFGIANSTTDETLFPLTRHDIVLIEKPALSWVKNATVLDLQSAKDISKIDVSGIDFSEVDFTSKDTLGESMTLISSETNDLPAISANGSVNINNNGNISKIETGGFKDFDNGVTVNYEPFQQIVSNGKAIISTIKGRVKEIVFGIIPWKETGSLIEKTENLDFNGAKVDTTAIHFKDITELNTNDSMILVEGFGETDETNIVGTEYTIGTTLKGEGSAKIENENLVFVVKTGTNETETDTSGGNSGNSGSNEDGGGNGNSGSGENSGSSGSSESSGNSGSSGNNGSSESSGSGENSGSGGTPINNDNDDDSDDDTSWIDDEEEKKKQEEAEKKRLEEEKKKQEEAEKKRLEEEKKKQEEAEKKRLEEEKKKQEEAEKKRLEEEKKKQEEAEKKRLEEEKKKREEAEKKRLEEEKKKQEEAEKKRLEEEKKKQEEAEKKRLEEEKKKQEEAEKKRLEEEKKKQEEAEKKRLEEEKKKQEEAEKKRLEEERKKREEEERQEKLNQAKLKVQEQTHNAVMGMQAGIVALAAANDFVQTAMEQISTEAKTSADGVAVYAGMGGGKSNTSTGSGVDARTWNAIVALGQERSLKSGMFSYGAFFEYGRANYTIEPDNGMDGTSKYTGGGVFAKKTNVNNTYIEGSLRAGNMKDSANGILEDVAGNSYGYNVSSSYFGAHIGVGRVYKLKNGFELDCYGKFFYTRRGGVSYNAGGQYDLDAVSSKVLRIGARYGKRQPGWNSYVGLSYAYEFDGVARGRADGYAIRPAKTTGGTVYGEIGLRLLPSSTSRWKSNIMIKAHAGKSRGIGGHFSIAYLF